MMFSWWPHNIFSVAEPSPLDTSAIEKHYADQLRLSQMQTQSRFQELFNEAAKHRRKLKKEKQKEIKERIALARANKPRKVRK